MNVTYAAALSKLAAIKGRGFTLNTIVERKGYFDDIARHLENTTTTAEKEPEIENILKRHFGETVKEAEIAIRGTLVIADKSVDMLIGGESRNDELGK